MAINSYGYPREISPGSIFARIAESFGHRYSVDGFSDFRVTIASTGTRRVNIAAGWSLGKGIKVQNTASTFKELAAPSGSTQWFLIGLKRWITNPIYDPEADPGTPEGSPYISDIVVVNGTASRAVPTVTQNAGTDDTQWLALARVITGSTAVQEVIDLRLISGEGGAGYQVFSDLAMAQVANLVGTEVYRADTTDGHVPTYYKVVSSPAGVLSWKNPSLPDSVITGASATESFFPGWGRDASCIMVRDGHMRYTSIMVNKSGGAETSDSVGRILEIDELVKFHPEDRPRTGTAPALAGYIETETGGRFFATGRLGADGTLRITSTWSGRAVRSVILSGTYSVA